MGFSNETQIESFVRHLMSVIFLSSINKIIESLLKKSVVSESVSDSSSRHPLALLVIANFAGNSLTIKWLISKVILKNLPILNILQVDGPSRGGRDGRNFGGQLQRCSASKNDHDSLVRNLICNLVITISTYILFFLASVCMVESTASWRGSSWPSCRPPSPSLLTKEKYDKWYEMSMSCAVTDVVSCEDLKIRQIEGFQSYSTNIKIFIIVFIICCTILQQTLYLNRRISAKNRIMGFLSGHFT